MTTPASCPGCNFSRRDMLKLASAGVATLLGMSVRNLVAFAGTDSPATAEHVILIWLEGGMSHIDTFDPKPGRKTAGEFQPIKTSASGIEISEILPKIAAQMKHASILRSISGNNAEHGRATYEVLTGYAQTPQLLHPSFGSIVAHEKPQIGELPSFVAVGSRALASGYLGQQCEAYFIGNPGQPDPYLSLPEGITQGRAQRRMELLARANSHFDSQHPDKQLSDVDTSYQAARRFMQSPAIQAFDLDKESAAVRESYGDSDFGRGCLLARRLVNNGVRFVQVSTGGFDTHGDNFNRMRRLGRRIDNAIGSLISDLAADGKLDKTLIFTLSEFGRTPTINGNAGRDHWPHVFSSLMAGGGVKKGQLIGASDVDGAQPAERPVAYADMHATLCAALGIDATKKVETPLGRPMRLVEKGAAVKELFA